MYVWFTYTYLSLFVKYHFHKLPSYFGNKKNIITVFFISYLLIFMEKNISSLLDNFGMKQKEQEIYLTVLKLWEMSIAQIASYTKKPRSSCYDIVTAMAKKMTTLNSHS